MSWEDTLRTVYFVAGDVSGDQNCGRLAAAIRREAPDVQLLGAGGAAMREAGVRVRVETTQLSFVGIPGPRLVATTYRRYRAVMNEIDAVRPDAVVLVDNEWTNLVLATLLRRRRIPVVFFFPPQVWLWGRWRLPTIVPLGDGSTVRMKEVAEGGATTSFANLALQIRFAVMTTSPPGPQSPVNSTNL